MNTQNIGDLVKQLAKTDDELYSLPCKFKGLDSDGLAELEPLNGDPNLIDVRLIAGSAEAPFMLVPALDSVVLATFMSKDTAFISLYSEVDSIQLRGDSLGGLIKIEELVDNLALLTARVDGIISALENATPAPSPDAGAGLLTSIKLGLSTIGPKEDFSNLENEKVKHG